MIVIRYSRLSALKVVDYGVQESRERSAPAAFKWVLYLMLTSALFFFFDVVNLPPAPTT